MWSLNMGSRIQIDSMQGMIHINHIFALGNLDMPFFIEILNITIRKYSTKILRYKTCCGCSEINVLQHFFFLYLGILLRTMWEYFFLVNYFLECLQQHISVSISKPRWYSFEIMHRKTIPNQIKHTFYARYRFTLFSFNLRAADDEIVLLKQTLIFKP